VRSSEIEGLTSLLVQYLKNVEMIGQQHLGSEFILSLDQQFYNINNP